MRRAIVTGGASGLGAACATRLRADGIDVITFDVSAEADQRVDVTDLAAVERAVAAVGGPLAFVRTGDIIRVDVAGRSLSFDVTDEELQSRGQAPASEAAYASPVRGWEKLYVDHVMQADTGADLDFLVGASGDEVRRESH